MIRWVIGLALLAPPAFGCTCGTADVFKAPTLFIGEVVAGGITSLREDPWNSRVSHVRFRVLENFRGLAADTKTVDVDLFAIPGMCSPIPYFFGKQYLVLLSQEDGHFVDGPCFNGLEVTENAQIVNRVRNCFGGKPVNQIQGVVTTGGPGCGVLSARLCQGGKPLGGAVVCAMKDGHVYRTATGSDGSYRLELPRSGEYQLQAVLDPYLSQPPVQIAVGGDGCQVHDFVMRIDNTISGSVRDERGKLVSEAVGLIDLDDADRSSETRLFALTRIVKASQGFRFENVPLGRYLIVSNPEGPAGDWFQSGLPFEPTYYPGASRREKAQIIRIGTADVHLNGIDLVIGSRPAFRRVRVSVRFPDGKPMKWALLTCVGSPPAGDALEWRFSTISWKRGAVRFSAPADRKLRIEVTDSFGRDLKASYVSTYEPGRSAIVKEVVVSP